MTLLRPGPWLFRLLVLALLCGLAGCGSPKGSAVVVTVPATTPVTSEGKLEVDAALTGAGLEFQEKSRDAQRILLVVRSPKQDHESSNYRYTLFDSGGSKLSSTGFSVIAFKQGESFEFEIRNDDLPKASRIVIGPFGK